MNGAAGDRRRLASIDWGSSGLDRATIQALSAALLERIGSLPGVAAAGASTMLPLGFSGHAYVTPRIASCAGSRRGPGHRARGRHRGLPRGARRATRRGTRHRARRRPSSPRVAVVNRELVRRFFAGKSAIGRSLDWGDGPRRIVGIVENAVVRDLGEPPYPMVFVPLFQSPAVGSVTRHVLGKRSAV